jgi:hypothetical protein
VSNPDAAVGSVDWTPAASTAALRVEADEQRVWNRWLPFARPLLVLPQVAWGVVLLVPASAAYLVSGAVVVATGRYPRSVYGFVAGLGHWLTNCAAYLWSVTDAYPPFALGPQPNHPVRLTLAREPPRHVARWRPLAGWLLVVPHTVYLAFLYAGLIMLIPTVMLSIGRGAGYPPALRRLVVGTLTFQARITAYVFFVADERPSLVVEPS